MAKPAKSRMSEQLDNAKTEPRRGKKQGPSEEERNLADALNGVSEEMEELRKTNQRLAKNLAKTKARTNELVQAVYTAARDAALTIGPPPPVAPPKSPRRSRQAEVALIHATDWQYGKVTESYSMEVCEQRMALFSDKIGKLNGIQRADHPVNEAHILFGGDMVEGTTIFPGQAFEIEATLYTQLFGVVRLMEDFIRRQLANFRVVHVWEEYGNHGRLGRKGEQPGSDNIDRMAYKIASEKFVDNKRVIWHHSSSWHQIVEIGNYRALLVHGDEIKSFGGNCVTPDVRVLTSDLRWVPAGELAVGDELLAFDEHGDPERRYQTAEVTATGIHERDVWRITFDDGTFVRCTPEHPWVVSSEDDPRHGGEQSWQTPEQIASRLDESADIWMLQPVHTWSAPTPDSDSELLAGAFTTHGTLTTGAPGEWPVVSYTHGDDPVLSAVKLALDAKGFTYKERTGVDDDSFYVHHLELPASETLRFLGQIRALNLLDEWVEGKVSKLAFMGENIADHKRIIACAPDGRADICALTSSSATYITEHGPAHNTPAFGILRKCNAWATGVVDPFEDVYMGHFHTPMTLTMANGGRIFVSGSPESDNQYAKEFVAAKGKPSQRLHYVDPERGRVTSEYTIWLD